MPLLSYFHGFRHITQNRQLLAQLTCIDLWFFNDRLDVVSMARVFYKARNLQDLKLTFCNCKPWRASTPLAVAEIPPPLSVKINTLKITVSGDNPGPKSMVYNIIQPLHNALSYLLPSQIDICLDHCPFETLYGTDGEFFPDGDSIRLDIAGPCSMINILATLLRRCVIASSVHFKAPKAFFLNPLCDRDIWPSSPSIRRVSFRNCDTITEGEVKALANRLLSCRGRVGLQFLELHHCKDISEECLLNLHDEFGDKLVWKL
ncbi:hypothetical protein BD410DRAFT_277678 [Rickenella mellea]|uniref:F-box domain-containing protein n=1 Tax=Rickenella mellea TaxID=50990 RepID=A0A4Y7PFN5_9AGAM|nr:hypothetical protein BD410DRAFT_277678 [Rickenella mellea]